jgi:DNA-binding IclR family transcriptional regulator
VTAETSQTLDRGVKVLKLLADSERGLTVTELAARLAVNRTVVYRLLATLEQHGLVPERVGPRVVEAATEVAEALR